MSVRIIHGATPDALADIPDGSIDACVTDPPYGIGFMGKEWDTFKPDNVKYARANPERDNERHANLYGRTRSPAQSPSQIAYDYTPRGLRGFQEWTEQWAREVFRVLKPGGYLLCSGAPRSYHRAACGIEDAGFEVRDAVLWLFGQGFPKSLDVAKAIDRELGAQRAVSGIGETIDRIALDMGGATGKAKNGLKAEYQRSSANTAEAEAWEGWGTAMKPAWEPIIMARKPLIGTVAANVLAHGTGALNIDACRVPTGDDLNGGAYSENRKPSDSEWVQQGGTIHSYAGKDYQQPEGRWPANVIHDGSDCVVAEFPAEAGAFAPVRGTEPSQKTSGIYGGGFKRDVPQPYHGDTGSAARFFYCAKASRADRDDGMHGFEKKPLLWSSGEQSPGTFQSPNTERAARNFHPTVKPTELMAYLCKLVTPPGGTILDPFMGSGSTGRGAVLGGFNFIGVEREAEYVEIARARIRAIAPLFAEVA